MIKSVKVEEILPDGTKREVTKDDNTHHHFLIAFNTLIDLDYAILRMIRAEYNNPKFINQTIMSASQKDIKELLLNRIDPNPVTVCIDDRIIADNIYREIMTTRYKDLISPNKYMDITGVFFLVSVFSNLDDVDITILCASERESQIIKRYHSKVNTLVMEDPSELDVDKYTDFIFKSYMDVYKFDNDFKEKRISLLNYRFNIDLDDEYNIYPKLDFTRYMYENGLNATVLVDVYKQGEPDTPKLKIVVKKKPDNN